MSAQTTIRYIGKMTAPFAERLPDGERLRIVPGQPMELTGDTAKYLTEMYPDRYEAVKETPKSKPEPAKD